MKKIGIDWDRVYSGFVASGLSLREFRSLHLQSFCNGDTLPSHTSFARHMKLVRERHQDQAQQFSEACDTVENVLQQAVITPTELSSDASLITLDEQQLNLLTGQSEDAKVQAPARTPICSGILSVFLPGGLRLEMQIDNPAFFIAQLSCAMKKHPATEIAS